MICNIKGRSMVEMLGVLAIVALLSIIGLAGFSRAMLLHRINTTFYDITYIVNNVHNLFHRQSSYKDLGTSNNTYMSSNGHVATKVSNSAKLFPDNIIKNNYKNSFGGDIKLFATGRFKQDDLRAFNLEFWKMPQEACMQMAMHSWNNLHGLIALKIRGSHSDTTPYSLQKLYETKCTTKYETGIGVFCAKDIPLSPLQAAAVCDVEIEYLSFKFN